MSLQTVADDAPAAASEHARIPSWCADFVKRVLGTGPRFLWSIHFGLIVLIACWAFFDPLFEVTAMVFNLAPVERFTQLKVFEPGNSSHMLWWRVSLLFVVRGTVLITLLLLGIGLWRGSKQYRSLKSLLMLVTLISLWAGLVASLSNITWYGKLRRVSGLMEQLEPVVADLQENWPSEDGRSPELGQYMAYPIGYPSCLVLLTPPVLDTRGTTISTVEHAVGGGVRFHLAGSELGDWLEFHPVGQEPTTFQGGLGEFNDLVRTEPIGAGWFLVRYEVQDLAI